jgi:hypothetical protein
MTGPYDSVLGRRVDRVLFTTTTFIPSPFDVATGDVRLAGAVVEVDPATGRATSIRRYTLDEAGLAALQAAQAAPPSPNGASPSPPVREGHPSSPFPPGGGG